MSYAGTKPAALHPAVPMRPRGGHGAAPLEGEAR